MEKTRDEIRTFLARFIKNYEVKDNDDIFAMGFVNSLFAMQLVLFVESTYGITVENEDLDVAHFQSINAIVNLIERKQSVSA